MGKLISNEELMAKRLARATANTNEEKKGPAGRVVNIRNRRSFLENKKVSQRIDRSAITDEMKQNGETTVFDGSHITSGNELPHSLRELKRFLGTLSNYERIKVERLVEDITLDARVHDRSFTCTMVYLRSNKDPEVSALYKKIRVAIFANLGVMLPEIPDDVA